MRYSSAISILTILTSLVTACGSTKLVTPKINYATYAEVKKEQPNCASYIDAMERAFQTGSGLDAEAAALDTLNCYRAVWGIWENQYRILDSKLKMLNEAE